MARAAAPKKKEPARPPLSLFSLFVLSFVYFCFSSLVVYSNRADLGIEQLVLYPRLVYVPDQVSLAACRTSILIRQRLRRA
jgi:hypothetical protein